ncbi:hypothetical protein PV326_003185, partial [Microctonus aethiopoides]
MVIIHTNTPPSSSSSSSSSPSSTSSRSSSSSSSRSSSSSSSRHGNWGVRRDVDHTRVDQPIPFHYNGDVTQQSERKGRGQNSLPSQK